MIAEKGLGTLPLPFSSKVFQGSSGNLGSTSSEERTRRWWYLRGIIGQGRTPWSSFAPSLPGNSSGMPSYCTDKKREEGVSGKWYVRMLKKIMAAFIEHLICAGRIPDAAPVLCPS